ncbi:hypothetical protein KW787_03745 [Candidatus Pacearchaeota archaeon]|nr:hypothetical protein [Candidatus Pacearchaeota archaeon]
MGESLKEIVLKEELSNHRGEQRVDFSLRRGEAQIPFAIAYTMFLDEHYVLREVNDLYLRSHSSKRITNPSPEDGLQNKYISDIGVSHTFEEARNRLYKRASHQGKVIAKKENRHYREENRPKLGSPNHP